MTTRKMLFATTTLLILATLLAQCTDTTASHAQSDLTIFVGGDLLRNGGVVFVHPIPVSQERWQAIVAEDNLSLPPPEGLEPIDAAGKRMTTTISGQATHIQFLYPKGKRQYTFRFRPVPEADAKAWANFGSRLLTIGGVNSETGLGEEMTFGFTGLHDSGRQIIHVAQKGTEPLIGRSLVGAVENPQPEPHEVPQCITRSAISACGYDEMQWRRIAARWEKQRRESEGEARRFVVLNACYRGAERQGRTGGHCDLKSADGADPIVYDYVDKAP